MLSVKINSRSVFWICVVLAFYAFIYLFSDITFPFVVGFVLAYFCVPLIDTLSKRMNRSLASIIFVMIAVLVFVVVGIVILPKLTQYLMLVSAKIPQYYEQLASFISDKIGFVTINQDDVNAFKKEMQKYLDKKVYIFASIVSKIASRGEEIRNFFSFFIVMPISFFYFLKDWDPMMEYIHGCIPQRHRHVFTTICKIVRKTLRNFLHGQFYVVAALSAYYTISLKLIGIEHYVLLGIISGVLSFIPLLGALLSCVLVMLMSSPMLTMMKLYVIMAIYFVGQFAEGYVLYPKFVGKKTGLHPLWILFSFFAGIKLQGVVGVLISIPSAAVIRNLIGFAINKFKSTQAYKQ